MSNPIIRALWGDLKGNELKKFVLLALGFFFIIGSYWPLKTLKDSIFLSMVGVEYQPLVKILSVTLLLPLVLLYSRLIDSFSKEKMVYLIVTIYGIIGLIFVACFYHPEIGLQNTAVGPFRLLGWTFFLFVESYISLMISLFWSFTHDITTPESAKKGYGLIIFGTQLGGLIFIILGNILSADVTLYASRAPLIMLISVSLFFLVGITTFLLKHVVNEENLQSYQEEHNIVIEDKASVGFFDGLKLLVTHPYVGGIFGIIFFHEAISTIIYFQMQWLVSTTYSSGGMVNKFMFQYALAVQAIACLFGLFGTSFFQRRFGIKFCIVAYPLLLGLSIAFYLITPSLQSIFYVMMIAKAINFAFNQPAKEVLYIPTTKSIKYKSKAWVDMFGMRFAKGFGSVINKFAGPIISVTGPLTLGLIGIWALLAGRLGNTFNKAIDEKKLIE